MNIKLLNFGPTSTASTESASARKPRKCRVLIQRCAATFLAQRLCGLALAALCSAEFVSAFAGPTFPETRDATED